MKIGTKLVCGILAAISMAICASSTQAATITLLGDSGSLRVVTPTLASNSSIVSPYGTAIMPTITQTSATSYQIDFVPTADFFASASAQPAGQTTTLDGKLDLLVAFPSAIQLTTNIFEDGLYLTSGTGTVNVTGGVVVTAVDPITHVNLAESHGNTFGAPSLNGNGTWRLSDQLTGFSGDYTTYKISIDNVLLAQALLPTPTAQGDAWIAKKDFSLILTSDGSGGRVPEPASLGVLAIGGLALLARRRRA